MDKRTTTERFFDEPVPEDKIQLKDSYIGITCNLDDCDGEEFKMFAIPPLGEKKALVQCMKCKGEREIKMEIVR